MELLDLLVRLLFILYFGLRADPTPPTPVDLTPVPGTQRFMHVIEGVEAVVVTPPGTGIFSASVQLNVRGYQPDSCEYPVQVSQTYNGFNIEVSIYRNVPINVRCAGAIIPYQSTISLPGVFAPGTYSLNVNGYVTQFTVPGAQPAPSKILTVIESITPSVLESFPAQVQIQVSGYHPDGCQYPVQVVQNRSANLINVQIFREVPADVVCTLSTVPYQQTIMLDGSFEPGEYIIYVNGFEARVTIEGGQQPAPSKIETVIESVTPVLFESLPVQIEIQVSGYHPDGCQYPAQVVQSRSGNTVNVNIFREVPADVMCPPSTVPYQQTIMLDGGFQPGEYVINVNGFSTSVVVDGGEPQPGIVDTVIESVSPVRLPSVVAYPAPVEVHVSGYHPHGCQLPVQVVQSRSGNTFNIHIYHEIYGDCPDTITPYQDAIMLSEGLEAGTYTIIVNGVAATITV